MRRPKGARVALKKETKERVSWEKRRKEKSERVKRIIENGISKYKANESRQRRLGLRHLR